MTLLKLYSRLQLQGGVVKGWHQIHHPALILMGMGMIMQAGSSPAGRMQPPQINRWHYKHLLLCTALWAPVRCPVVTAAAGWSS